MSKTISKSLMKSMLLVLILAATSTMATAAMTVSTSDSSRDSGTTVQIPVNLSDAPTLGSLGFTLTYDSDVLTNTGYTTGDIFKTGSMEIVNNGTPGTIIASVIKLDGINTAASGSILVFTFTVTGTTGQTSDLALSSVSASNTSAVPVDTETSTGTFTVAGVPTGMGVITSDSSRDSGTIVQIPVNLSDAPTLGSLGFTLTYDSDVLTNTGYTTGDIFKTGSMEIVNNGTPGTIIASVIKLDGINTAASGSILVFTFTVTGTTGQTSDLALSSVSASNTSAVPVETYTSSGTFTVGAAAPTLTWQTEPPASVTQGNDVTFDVIFSESADYYFRVENSTGGVVWRYPETGTGHAMNPGERTWTTTADTPTGDYTIIININGADNSGTKTVTVSSAANQAPTAFIASPTATGTYRVGEEVSFLSTGSSDLDGTIETYTWDFGDGNTSTIASTTHTYATADTYTVTLTVTDNEGVNGTETVTINVLAAGAVVVHLYTGWNLIAIPVNDTSANTAAGLASKIDGCKEVVMWNVSAQTYDPYSKIGDTWTETDFAITGGMGIFVNVEDATTVGFTGDAWS